MTETREAWGWFLEDQIRKKARQEDKTEKQIREELARCVQRNERTIRNWINEVSYPRDPLVIKLIISYFKWDKKKRGEFLQRINWTLYREETRDVPAQLRDALSMYHAGTDARRAGDDLTAKNLLHQSLEIGRQFKSPGIVFSSSFELGNIYYSENRSKALIYFLEAEKASQMLPEFRQLPSYAGLLAKISIAYFMIGDKDISFHYAKKAETVLKQVEPRIEGGFHLGIIEAFTYIALSMGYFENEDLESGIKYYTVCYEKLAEIGLVVDAIKILTTYLDFLKDIYEEDKSREMKKVVEDLELKIKQLEKTREEMEQIQ